VSNEGICLRLDTLTPAIGFDLDGDAGKQGDSSSSVQDAPAARRSSFAEQLAANTASNAALGRAASSGSDAPSARTTSRSPSFTLPPGSRRSSSASNRAEGRGAVRDEMAARDRMDVDSEEAMDDDDDDDELDPEGQSPLCLARCRRLTSGHHRASAAPGLCAEAQPGVWHGCLCVLQTLLTPLTALRQRS